jgi:hypothetical protein
VHNVSRQHGRRKTKKLLRCANVRPVDALSAAERIEGVLVVTRPKVVAGKVISCIRRRGKPKSFTGRRDLAHMLLKFPELKVKDSVVEQRLKALGADGAVLDFWHELVAEVIIAPEADDDFECIERPGNSPPVEQENPRMVVPAVPPG